MKKRWIWVSLIVGMLFLTACKNATEPKEDPPVAESILFTIDLIEDTSIAEYKYMDEEGYIPPEEDEEGRYISVIPHLSGGTPVKRVVYTLDGADAEEFIINRKTGQVFLDPKDFEHPTDANQDNIYEVTITVTDEAGNSDSESWNVTITNRAGDAPNKHLISMNGASLLRVKAGTVFTDPGVTLIPIDDGTHVALKTAIYSNYTLDPPLDKVDTNNSDDRVYHIIYSAEDSADSTKSAPMLSRTIIVEGSDPFDSVGALISVTATGRDGSSQTFSSLEEDYIQKALYYVWDHQGGTVLLGKGTHYFNRQLVIYSDTTLRGTLENGEKVSRLKLMDFALRKAWKNHTISWGNIHSLIVNAAAPEYNAQYDEDMTERAFGSSHIVVKDLILDGNREEQRAWKSAGSNNSIGLKLYHSRNVLVDNIDMVNTLSDGIATEGGADLNVSHSTFRFMGHSALFIVETKGVTTDHLTVDILSNSGIRFFGGSDFTITNNHLFSTTNGGNFAIQISNNYSAGIPLENVLIENNIIRHTAIAGIGIYTNTTEDVIQGVTIQNNIIYRAASVTSNKPAFMEIEPSERLHEGGSINIQYVKQIDINHNTIFNGQGSAIRIDNRFYIPDGTAEDWENLNALDRMARTASITNNVLVGNKISNYEEYSDAVAYGIEKRVATQCGDNKDEVCPGTTITTANNLFADNDSGAASGNITLSGSDQEVFPGFVDAPLFDHDIREISYYYDEETNVNLNLVGISDPQIGASAEMLQRSLDLYDTYKHFFISIPD